MKDLEAKGINLEDFYRETIEKADVVAAQAKEAAANAKDGVDLTLALASDNKEEKK